jgi:hypothetical protein
MTYIANIYAELIKKEEKTINDVPVKLIDEVMKILYPMDEKEN